MTRFANENAYDAIIRDASARYGVPVGIVKGVIAQESKFNPRAVRGEPQLGDASMGLMQILLATAKGLGHRGTADELFNPAVNIPLGTKYLAQLYRRAGDWPAAISAYNGGFRPELAFGSLNTKPGLRVCLARDQRTGACITWRDVPLGEFGNQPHVDHVMGYARTYGYLPPAPPIPGPPTNVPPVPTQGGASPIAVAILLGVGLAVLGALKLLKGH